MRKTLFAFAILCIFTGQAQALTFYCANCSNQFTQALERVTSLEQLSSMLKQYSEAVTQTAQQIEMVKQNLLQYENMLKNTLSLPQNLLSELNHQFTKLASMTSNLRVQRGDMVALGEIFSTLFPDQGLFKDLVNSSPEEMDTAKAQYRQTWDNWAEAVDTASQATFQLTGQQLQDLQQDSSRLQSYINDLLSTPEGQMQALQSGNQLAALQIEESRQLRELMAASVQSSVTAQMQAEKQSQMEQEAWREATDTGNLGRLTPKPDPF